MRAQGCGRTVKPLDHAAARRRLRSPQEEPRALAELTRLLFTHLAAQHLERERAQQGVEVCRHAQRLHVVAIARARRGVVRRLQAVTKAVHFRDLRRVCRSAFARARVEPKSARLVHSHSASARPHRSRQSALAAEREHIAHRTLSTAINRRTSHYSPEEPERQHRARDHSIAPRASLEPTPCSSSSSSSSSEPVGTLRRELPARGAARPPQPQRAGICAAARAHTRSSR